MNSNFDTFWKSSYAVPLASLLDEKTMAREEQLAVYKDLHQ